MWLSFDQKNEEVRKAIAIRYCYLDFYYQPLALRLPTLPLMAKPKERYRKRTLRDSKVKETLKAAGLRYVNDGEPGISRVRAGKAFQYKDANGKPVRDAKTLSRIKSLAIPPAWKEVWICTYDNGHIQAIGRDAKGRKQYRYHPRWRAQRDETKYDRMVAFGQALPRLREKLQHHLSLPGLPREKVLATIVQLLETTLIRVGNEEYARTNGSFGLTTMRNRHVKVEGAKLRFQFRGKSGIRHAIDLEDRRLARVVKRCQDLPGQELFQYLDDEGIQQSIGSSDVNAYLREITGGEFTAKDFRTWAGTVQATITLQKYGRFESDAEVRRNILRAIEEVAARLGNTPAVCRKSYVHPLIFEFYLSGVLLEHRIRETSQISFLQPGEVAVLNLLQQQCEKDIS